MYLASIYEWPAVRSFHAAVLSEIERGRLNWEDSFLHLENRTLAGLHKKTKEQKRHAPSSSNAVLFCRDYQKGSCSHSKDHYAMLKGEKKWLCHICAACWVKDKAKRMHSEYADDCPNKPKEWLDNTPCIPLIQDFIVAGSQDVNRTLFQDNCVVGRTSAQAFRVHQDSSEFHRTPFQEFCNTVHNQALSQTVIQDTVASLITDNQEVSQTVVQDTVSSLVTSRTLSLDTSAYGSHEEFSVHMVALHRRVFASGVPNYRGLRIPVPSKLIVPRWRS